MFFSGYWFSDKLCQVFPMNHCQLVKGSGSRYIKQLDIAVFPGIFLLRRVVEKHCVKLQSLGIFHWKDHDPFPEFCSFQVALC